MLPHTNTINAGQNGQILWVFEKIWTNREKEVEHMERLIRKMEGARKRTRSAVWEHLDLLQPDLVNCTIDLDELILFYLVMYLFISYLLPNHYSYCCVVVVSSVFFFLLLLLLKIL